MPSSTFNSEEKLQVTAQTGTRAMVILLALIALILVGLEAATRVVVERESKVQQELNREYKDAVHIRRNPASHQKQLLIIGNSLVGHGLNFSMVEQGLSPEWQVHRYWIYNTGYEDWYFGMRRLLAEGSRPDVVGITLAALHWFAPGIRGDYSAAYMFQAADIPELASELNLDRTRASGLVFARYSKFYALRSETRKAVLQTLMPDLPRMYDLFKPTASKPKPPEQVLALLKPRIERMRDLVQSYGATLVLIVPPIPRPGEEYHAELAEVGRQLRVQVFMPMTCSDLPAKDFVDDMHLSSRGAALYTSKLLAVMRPALDSGHTPGQIAAKR